MAALTPGATVVDIGCGAGMDLMLAAGAVGPGGHAIGIDMNIGKIAGSTLFREAMTHAIARIFCAWMQSSSAAQ